ncbi:F-box domain-containing protein [Phlyctema vagabunda]|uniref:F-box domain-containing protein n=1 Tax=Phlyctema vagabunda TaxID=108571 RepID=A0ABR4PPW3_9HELO
MEDSNSELESFRQKWRAEVSAKAKEDVNKERQKPSGGASKPARKAPAFERHASEPMAKGAEDEEDHTEPRTLHQLDGFSGEVAGSSKSGSREPRSALEYFEKAVEREALGSLGDSLDLYRKAYRLDDKVDQRYKNKHFPPSSFTKPTNPNPSNASATVPNTAHHSLDGHPQTFKELIASFLGLKIEPAPPAIEGTTPPPCPLGELPDEILLHICKDVAVMDVASFVRLAQVSKRLAFLVATEEQVWKRVCLGSEVGFGAMHYTWQRNIVGDSLEEETFEPLEENPKDEVKEVSLDRHQITDALYQNSYLASWHQMFRLRPRIRFNGCYISTVNYIRPGQASISQVSWNSPVHIVTYYRYLRFFRDGTVISLLTTSEPADVVHHLTKELSDVHRNGGNAHLPSIVMQNALRGRWRLSSIDDYPGVDLKEAEGDLIIETEGATGPRYIYRLELSLRSSGKGAKNNKLVWKGFWSHNVLTDDVAPFTLRNDKAFFWSRVRSYGNGA